MPKVARTSIEVHEFIAERWSPRSFDEHALLRREQLVAMLEAARWAPSAGNLQPWRFAVGLRGTDLFEGMHATLAPGNRAWAHRASALILAASEVLMPNGDRNPWATYDLGSAVSLLIVQGQAMGLHTRQIGGFDQAAVSRLLDLPLRIEPVVVLAVGTVADPRQLDEGPLRDREVSDRQRRRLEDIVLAGLEWSLHDVTVVDPG